MLRTSTDRHHVVIIGAGFGGIEVAKELAGTEVDVTIIDRRNHHLHEFDEAVAERLQRVFHVGPYEILAKDSAPFHRRADFLPPVPDDDAQRHGDEHLDVKDAVPRLAGQGSGHSGEHDGAVRGWQLRAGGTYFGRQ